MTQLTRQIVVFVALVAVLSLILETVMLLRGGMAAGDGFSVYAVMWCPTLAAIITCRIFKIDLVTLGWNWRPVKYEWMGYALPLLYAAPVYVVAWLAIDGAFAYDRFAQAQAKSWNWPEAPNQATWFLAIPMYAIIGVIRSL